MKNLPRLSPYLFTTLGVSVCLMGCSAMAPPESAKAEPSEEPTAVESEQPEVHPEASATPSSLHLIEALAAQVAVRWKTEQAITDEITLFIRFRLDGKSAAVLTNASGAQVITGMRAATTRADVIVDVTREDADAIAEGSATIFTALDAGTLTIDNPDGFNRFLEYVEKD